MDIQVKNMYFTFVLKSGWAKATEGIVFHNIPKNVSNLQIHFK